MSQIVTQRHQFLVLLALVIIVLTPMPLFQSPKSDAFPSEDVLIDTHDTFVESDVILGHVDYSIYNTPDAFDGYNLFVLLEQPLVEGGNYGNLLLIMDMNGNVIAQKQIGDIRSWHCPAEFIDPNTVLVGTTNGSALWHLENDSLQELGFEGSHEFEYNPNSDTVFTFEGVPQTIDGIDYLYETIVEYDMTGNLVWSWNVSDFIPTDWWCPFHDMEVTYRDISHSNTIYYDADDDIMYYMSRNTNTFFKLNHTSKEVIWGLGEHGNFTQYDLDGNEVDELFFHAHSVEPVDENTFILFDNDLHNQTNPDNQKSRMVEIQIDENKMIANETWYYEASTLYYRSGWGDADRLPNGNRVGTWGHPALPAGGPSAALIEVNNEGDIVWELDFQYNRNYAYGTYRMERFRFNPIISSPTDIVTVNSSAELSWDVWYNFRNKRTLPGNYTLYINGNPTQTGLFNYTKYWRPTTISIDTGSLHLGLYNVTLEIDDGFGNKASDSVNVTVKSFDISRTGRTSIEKGQTDFLPTWAGSTASPLFCNITLNSTLYEELNWTGQDILLDPSLIDIGSHLVTFQLFNQSLKVYEDIFWLYVGPTAPPMIVPLQSSEVSIRWSDDLVLSWNISDSAPHSWSILIDGNEIDSGDWLEPEFTLTWNVPLYPEGTYNITLVAKDLLGQWSKNETNLIVNPPIEPFILTAPDDATIAWGVDGISFEWETYNADTWTLWRNGLVYASGDATSGHVILAIADWLDSNWRIGKYNLTLQVLKDTYTAVDTFWLTILSHPGDRYANDVIESRSDWFLNSDSALGAPDGLFATIYVGYANGYLTLDMGENEEIIDGLSNDFTVYASGDEYSVSVSPSLTVDFIFLGTGTGTRSFDLSSSGLSEVQYVKITLISGVSVEIDAIEAINYNTPPGDTSPPYLEVFGDWFRIQYGSSAHLLWFASDESPWNYEIYENSTLVLSNLWNGSDIHYLFEPSDVGWWNVTLVVYDAFDNVAIDTVGIEVYSPNDSSFVITILGTGAAAVCLVIVVYVKSKRHS